MTISQSTKAAAVLPQPRAAATDLPRLAGVRDDNFNLISVIYHALKSAEACAQYVRDAEASGDEQLAQFFEETRGSQIELAQEAKQFLAERLDPTDIDEDPPPVG
jgi:hypothetical protein